MKKLFAALLPLLLLVGCRPAKEPPSPLPMESLTARAEARSVAIIDDDRAVCGGVWVSKTLILTAFHCVSDDGLPYPFIKYSDLWGTKTHPYHVYLSEIERYDTDYDLALLSTEGYQQPFQHDVAMLSTRVIHDGDPVDVVGSTFGLPFTAFHGQVAAARAWEETPYNTLELQVAGMNHGNSGGGAFDTDGRLIGIADFMYARGDATLNGVGFYVHRDAIRAFLYPPKESQ